MELSSQSTEYVLVPIPTAGVADVTTGTVTLAFLQLQLDPDGTTTWQAAGWVTGAAPPTARVLVGPGGLVLPAGVYRPWVKIAGFTPELPVFPSPGRLRVL